MCFAREVSRRASCCDALDIPRGACSHRSIRSARPPRVSSVSASHTDRPHGRDRPGCCATGYPRTVQQHPGLSVSAVESAARRSANVRRMVRTNTTRTNTKVGGFLHRPPRSSQLRPLDRAAPPPGLAAPPLDERLEPLEVTLHAAAHEAQRVARVLREALGVVLDRQITARVVALRVNVTTPSFVERSSLRQAIRSSGFWSTMSASHSFTCPPNVGDPVQAVRGELSHSLHAFHELRELFELRPLVGGRLKRRIDLDRLLDD